MRLVESSQHLMEANKVYASAYQSNFFFPYSPVLEGIINLHHDAFAYMVAVIILITYLLIRTIYLFAAHRFIFPTLIHHREQMYLEVAWTLFPTIVLFCIGLPSLGLLFGIEGAIEPDLTVHVMGHQWYWSYYFPTVHRQFDSCIIHEADLNMGELRLLEVDNRLVLPFASHIRVLITSADVIHSWTVPSFGIKVDATPGRLNQAHLFAKSLGVFHGQCSEICGVGHAFMPIVVQAVDTMSMIRFLTQLF